LETGFSAVVVLVKGVSLVAAMAEVEVAVEAAEGLTSA
jgi:hypothetical protein